MSNKLPPISAPIVYREYDQDALHSEWRHIALSVEKDAHGIAYYAVIDMGGDPSWLCYTYPYANLVISRREYFLLTAYVPKKEAN